LLFGFVRLGRGFLHRFFLDFGIMLDRTARLAGIRAIIVIRVRRLLGISPYPLLTVLNWIGGYTIGMIKFFLGV